MKIEQIKIEGLFGELNYDIRIEDNKLILVAENGSGKTTIVNIIYYFLSRQWTKLLRYRFEKVSAKINGETRTLNRKDIDILSSDKFKRLTKRYPPGMIQRINEFILSNDMTDYYRNPIKMEMWADTSNLPASVVYEVMNVINREQLNLFEQLIPEKGLSNLIDCQILYLPTFRRIEQDLKAIFPDLESDIEKYKRRKRGLRPHEELGYVELVEFGMEDVEDKIKYKLAQLRDNLAYKIKNNLTGGYLRDVINRTYLNISYNQIHEFNETALLSILDRIDESVLSKNEKSRLIQFVNEINSQGAIDKDETKIIAYFIYRLSTIYNELKEEEKDVENFINICNKYSGNKRFIYDNINFDITIKPLKNGKVSSTEIIELKDLSSGEKQIVSLFSHLFLSQQKNFYLIIDEPELSLSVPWQKKFIVDVISNPYCEGLLSVTHSPFIFDENELDKYAHGLTEFSFEK
ncbi:MAG: AAA family ATPase [Chitinophagaceae bacterium]|nr:AAA family ATPase [Chitinophagaceae bacterium]